MRRKGGAPLPKGQRKDILMRVIKTVFSFYPVMLPIALLFIRIVLTSSCTQPSVS